MTSFYNNHINDPKRGKNRSFSYEREDGLNVLKITKEREDIQRITQNYIDVVLQRRLEIEAMKEKAEIKQDLIAIACIFGVIMIFYLVGLFMGADLLPTF